MTANDAKAILFCLLVVSPSWAYSDHFFGASSSEDSEGKQFASPHDTKPQRKRLAAEPVSRVAEQKGHNKKRGQAIQKNPNVSLGQRAELSHADISQRGTMWASIATTFIAFCTLILLVCNLKVLWDANREAKKMAATAHNSLLTQQDAWVSIEIGNEDMKPLQPQDINEGPSSGFNLIVEYRMTNSSQTPALNVLAEVYFNYDLKDDFLDSPRVDSKMQTTRSATIGLYEELAAQHKDKGRGSRANQNRITIHPGCKVEGKWRFSLHTDAHNEHGTNTWLHVILSYEPVSKEGTFKEGRCFGVHFDKMDNGLLLPIISEHTALFACDYPLRGNAKEREAGDQA